MIKEKLPTAAEYIETIYGGRNFARCIITDDAVSLMDLMEAFSNHCNKENIDRITELEKKLSDERYHTLHYNDALDGVKFKLDKISTENARYKKALEVIAGNPQWLSKNMVREAKEALKGVE